MFTFLTKRFGVEIWDLTKNPTRKLLTPQWHIWGKNTLCYSPILNQKIRNDFWHENSEVLFWINSFWRQDSNPQIEFSSRNCWFATVCSRRTKNCTLKNATIWHFKDNLPPKASGYALIIEMFPLGYFGLLLVRYWRDNNQSKHQQLSCKDSWCPKA